MRRLCRAVDFLIMEGQNLSAVAPSFVPFGGALGSAQQAWVLIAALVMLPTVYLRNLGLLAYLSAAGVLTSLSLTCLVGTIAAEHGELPNNCTAMEHSSMCTKLLALYLLSLWMCQMTGFAQWACRGVKWLIFVFYTVCSPLSSGAASIKLRGASYCKIILVTSDASLGQSLRHTIIAGFANTQLPFLKPKGLPLAIGLLSFNYGGHSVFPSLYTSMKNPRQYFRVLDWTFSIVIGLYATMTVLGYLAYGETVK